MGKIFKEMFYRQRVRAWTAVIRGLTKAREALKSKQLKATAKREAYQIKLENIIKED